jgi:hypothetical protein
VFPFVFIQPGDWSFNRDCLISPEPAFILACEALRTNALGKFRVSSKGRFPILHHQNAAVIEFATRHTGVGIATGTFVFINNDLDRSLFKMHGHSSFATYDIKNPNLNQKLMFVAGSNPSAKPLIGEDNTGFMP